MGVGYLRTMCGKSGWSRIERWVMNKTGLKTDVNDHCVKSTLRGFDYIGKKMNETFHRSMGLVH